MYRLSRLVATLALALLLAACGEGLVSIESTTVTSQCTLQDYGEMSPTVNFSGLEVSMRYNFVPLEEVREMSGGHDVWVYHQWAPDITCDIYLPELHGYADPYITELAGHGAFHCVFGNFHPNIE